MRKLILGFVFTLFIAVFAYAQEPFRSEIPYTPNGFDDVESYLSEVLPLPNGGYIVKDYFSDPINYYYGTNARITRFDKCHNILWCKSIARILTNSHGFEFQFLNSHHLGSDWLWDYLGVFVNHSIVNTTDDCFISCNIFAGSLNNIPPAIIKFDKNGNTVWQKNLSANIPQGKIPIYGNILCHASTNGGCMVVFEGYNDSSHDIRDAPVKSPKPFISVVKMDRNGNVTNSNIIFGPSIGYKYGETYTPYPDCLLKMPDGGYMIHLESADNIVFKNDCLIRLDSNGHYKWTKSINFPNANYYYNRGYFGGASSTIDFKGNIYSSGLIEYYDPNSHSKTNTRINYIEKIDSGGNPVWFKYLPDTGSYMNSQIERIGIGTDNSLGAVIRFSKYNTLINKHAFYVRFDSKDSFRFAKLINNDTSGYNNNVGGYNEFVGSWQMNGTADSGFLYLKWDYYDYNFNSTTKPKNNELYRFDKDGKSPCLGKDTTIQFFNSTFTTDDEIDSTDVGFTGSDANMTVSDAKLKETVLCAPHLYFHADLGPDQVLCSGTSYILYKGSNNVGCQTLWSTGDTGSSITATKTGKYWLRVSHGFCTSTDTVNIVFRDQIKSGLAKKYTFCSYDSVVLKVKDTIPSYYWVTPKNKTISGPKITAKDSGIYYLKLNGTQDCAALDTVHVMYYPLPKGTAGPDTILCYKQIYTMQGAGGITYKWIPDSFLSSESDPNAKAQLPNMENYSLVISNLQGCRDTSHVLLKVKPALQVKVLDSNLNMCFGQAISISAKAHGGDSLNWKFNWLPGSLKGSSVTTKILQSSWHKVILSDNCSPANATDSVFVTMIPPAKADFNFIPGNPVKTNNSVHFFNQSQNASSYLWSFGNQGSSKEISPVYIYTDSGNYKVTLVAYGTSGCQNDTAYGYIKVIDGTIAIYIPNAFSPNGDGINDYFDINGTGIINYHYSIYNRWGEEIFLSSASHIGWDGSFRGIQVPEGVYIYQLEFVDLDGFHHYLSGNVTVIR